MPHELYTRSPWEASLPPPSGSRYQSSGDSNSKHPAYRRQAPAAQTRSSALQEEDIISFPPATHSYASTTLLCPDFAHGHSLPAQPGQSAPVHSPPRVQACPLFADGSTGSAIGKGCESVTYLRDNMASSYVYPQYLYNTPYLWPYYQQAMNSPFIPPAQMPPSPRAGDGSRRVRFADEEEQYPPTRPRPPSWHAGMAGTAPPPNPLPFPSPPFLYNPLPPVVGPPPGYVPHRRRSDSSVPGGHPAWVSVPAWMVYPQPVPLAPPPSQFHPLLNGEGGNRPLLFFDLSVHAFNPVRISSHGQTTGTALTLDELAQQATHPGVTRMEIMCDAISQWPIVLEPQPDRPSTSGYLSVPSSGPANYGPITVGDVLVAIHRLLQTQISHRDWARLTSSQETAIARAYTRRCRTFPSAEEFEARQGVRKVDYLLDKYMFRGLSRYRADDGFEVVRLLVGPR